METMMKLLSALEAADDGDNDDVVVRTADNGGDDDVVISAVGG
jgi:hypothetical protein